MIIPIVAAAVAAAQPAPAPATPPMGDQQMGKMHDMADMDKAMMAECHKCCEHMMAMMHEGDGTHTHQPSHTH